MGIAKVIAVFGLSGVGKSTTLQQVVAESGGLAIVMNAGALIGRRKQNKGSDENLRLLPTKEIQHNQEILIEELARERKSIGAQVLLLDGHCVIDNGDRLVPIPIEVIKKLDLAALVFVQEEVERIRERRLRDEKRSRPNLSVAELAKQQKKALEVCSVYASVLGLPLTIVTVEQWQLIAELVDEIAS